MHIKVILLLELLEVSKFFKQKTISGKQQVFVKTNNNNNENSNINNISFSYCSRSSLLKYRDCLNK